MPQSDKRLAGEGSADVWKRIVFLQDGNTMVMLFADGIHLADGDGEMAAAAHLR